jgi:hypothetical protein
MLNIKCDLKIAINCEGELQHYGGLIISPPDENNKYDKIHICIKCYELLFRGLKDTKDYREIVKNEYIKAREKLSKKDFLPKK